RLMNRWVWIVWLGGGVLGYVAGEMILEDPIIVRLLGEAAHLLHRVIPIVIGVGVTALGWWLADGKRGKGPEKVGCGDAAGSTQNGAWQGRARDGDRAHQVHAYLRGDRAAGQGHDRRGSPQERRPAASRAGPRREVRGEPHLGA